MLLGGVGVCSDHRAGRAGRPRGESARRAADDAGRARVRSRRLHGPGDGAERLRCTPSASSVMSLWGLMSPALQGLMTRLVSPCRAGSAAGREQQRARHRDADRSAAVHANVRDVHRRASRLAPAGCAVPALGVAARRLRWRSRCASWRGGCNACRPRIPDRYACALRARCTPRVHSTPATPPSPQDFRGCAVGTARALESASLYRFQLADEGG